MVSVVDICEEPPERFITRDRLEEIKSRVQRMPPGEYKADAQKIICQYLDSEGKILNRSVEIAEILHLGIFETYLNMKRDMEDLIRHVENADLENDFLVEKVKALQNV